MVAWVDHKMGMKRSRSQKKGTIQVQATLKKSKTVRFPLATLVVAAAHDMEEEKL